MEEISHDLNIFWKCWVHYNIAIRNVLAVTVDSTVSFTQMYLRKTLANKCIYS